MVRPILSQLSLGVHTFMLLSIVVAVIMLQGGGPCSRLEGCISMGPWGGPGGEKWSFNIKGGIKQIIIIHGLAIDSILFKSDDGNGLMEYSTKFGGNGGDRTDKIEIDWPMEYLTGLSGSYDRFYIFGPVVERSLCFYTNHTKYGPFGSNSSTSLSIPMEGGAIVGFHGRAGQFLDATGVYAKAISGQECHRNQEVIDAMKVVAPCDAGPWGRVGGKQWDDGVFSSIKEVHVHAGDGVIHAFQFQYNRLDGKPLWSQRHGGPGGEITNRIKLEGTSEFVIGITGFYGPIEGNDGFEAIRCIYFHTNKGKYGPCGNEVGKYFASGFDGKIVGFHGRSSGYLDEIGVHMAYNSDN